MALDLIQMLPFPPPFGASNDKQPPVGAVALVAGIFR